MGRDGRHGLDLLPDGRAVFTSLEGMNRDLWLVNPKSGSKQQLTVDQGDVHQQPFVTADGQEIYYSSFEDGAFRIKRVGVDGSGIRAITDGKRGDDSFPNVTPDGKTLFFLRKTNGKLVVIKKSLVDENEVEFVLTGGLTPKSDLTISPNGKYLAFRVLEKKSDSSPSESNRESTIGFVATDTTDGFSKIVRIETVPTPFHWDSESRAINYVRLVGNISTIWKQPVFDESAPIKLFETDKEIFDFEFTKKGDTIVALGAQVNDVVLVRDFD
jgi:hypothetical protein